MNWIFSAEFDSMCDKKWDGRSADQALQERNNITLYVYVPQDLRWIPLHYPQTKLNTGKMIGKHIYVFIFGIADDLQTLTIC